MRLAVPLFLLAVAPGCVTRWVEDALSEPTEASLTVRGDDVALAAIASALPRVEVAVSRVESGVAVVRILGEYADVLESLHRLIARNLELIANNEVTRALIAAALKVTGV